jgi:hypothetical protein
MQQWTKFNRRRGALNIAAFFLGGGNRLLADRDAASAYARFVNNIEHFSLLRPAGQRRYYDSPQLFFASTA